MPMRIQRMFDCQSRLGVLEAFLTEIGQRLASQPSDETLRQTYCRAQREALDLSCRLARMAAEG